MSTIKRGDHDRNKKAVNKLILTAFIIVGAV